MKSDNILFVANNTLRFIDYSLKEQIDGLVEIEEDKDIRLYKLLTRSQKDLLYGLKVNREIYNQYKAKMYKELYYNAPKTLVFETLNILRNQKFVKNIYILHDNKSVSEDGLTNIYYNGSIEELEDIINQNNITSTFIDDIEVMYLLINRGNIQINGFTFMISKLGYNYEMLDAILHEKHYSDFIEFSKKLNFEYAFVALFEIDSNNIQEKMTVG